MGLAREVSMMPCQPTWKDFSAKWADVGGPHNLCSLQLSYLFSQ